MTTKQTLLEIWRCVTLSFLVLQSHYSSIASTTNSWSWIRDGGMRGLFTGVGPRVARAGPSVGIVVSFYEVVKYAMYKRRTVQWIQWGHEWSMYPEALHFPLKVQRTSAKKGEFFWQLLRARVDAFRQFAKLRLITAGTGRWLIYRLSRDDSALLLRHFHLFVEMQRKKNKWDLFSLFVKIQW